MASASRLTHARGRTPATIAEQALVLIGARPQYHSEQERLLISLGKGGFLTWASSPHVMWLASRLTAAR